MPMQLLDEKEIQTMKAAYISDNTAYMRWSTEIEPKKDVIDSDFMRRNSNYIIMADKFAPLANFNDPRLIQLHKLKMINLTLEMNAGLKDSAELTVISAIDDIQVSRGDKGFYQRALITQRHEMQNEDRTTVERKVGFFNKLFSKKDNSPPQQNQGGPIQ